MTALDDLEIGSWSLEWGVGPCWCAGVVGGSMLSTMLEQHSVEDSAGFDCHS